MSENNKSKENQKRQFDEDQYKMLLRCSEKKDMTEWNEWRIPSQIGVPIFLQNYFDEKQAVLIRPIGYLLILSFLIGLLLLYLAVRNRAYFVPVTRQVNRIRKYFKENMEIEFDFGDMYINPAYPKYFNVFSTYSLTFT